MANLSINRVTLNNIGPFPHLDVSFPSVAGLNLICGDNGIGKTTVIDSIVAIFAASGVDRLKKKFGSDHGTANIEYTSNGAALEKSYTVNHFEHSTSPEFLANLNPLSPYVINIRAARDIQYVRSAAIISDPAPDTNRITANLGAGLNAAEIKLWLANRYLFRNNREGWTDSMLENLQLATDLVSILDSRVRMQRIDIKTFDLIVSTPSGDIPFEYMSSGFRSAYVLLLGIIKEIEYRGLDISAKDFAGVILIDELDLHLHPIWQREIGGILKSTFPAAQIIASTHSPHIIQAAQSAEVIALVREPDGMVVSSSVSVFKIRICRLVP